MIIMIIMMLIMIIIIKNNNNNMSVCIETVIHVQGHLQVVCAVLLVAVVVTGGGL